MRAKLKAKQKAPEWELEFGNTPEFYTRMYKVSSSCMTVAKRTCSALEWKIYKHTGEWCSAWYAYFPGLKGVILYHKGKGVARTFVYDGGYGNYIYGLHEDVMRELLDKGGHKEKFDMRIKIPKPFRVPAITYEGQKYCPMPRAEIVAWPFYVAYERNGFVFSHKYIPGGTVIHDCYDHGLWLGLAPT